jgi:hypothetical protein
MKRVVLAMTLMALVSSTLFTTACVIVPARAHRDALWVPGHWHVGIYGGRVWVPGHWH